MLFLSILLFLVSLVVLVLFSFFNVHVFIFLLNLVLLMTFLFSSMKALFLSNILIVIVHVVVNVTAIIVVFVDTVVNIQKMMLKHPFFDFAEDFFLLFPLWKQLNDSLLFLWVSLFFVFAAVIFLLLLLLFFLLKSFCWLLPVLLHLKLLLSLVLFFLSRLFFC